MQPRLITIPYSINGKLFDAYDATFALVQDQDWVCFNDGDTAFIEMANFGHLLQDYIRLYPNTGLFTCYASRCHYAVQRRRGLDPGNDSIIYWAKASLEVQKLHPQVKTIDRRIAGHLIMMKKAVWLAVRPDLKKRIDTKNKKILGFDTQLSETLLQHGYTIHLMRGIKKWHYLRKLTGKNKLIK